MSDKKFYAISLVSFKNTPTGILTMQVQLQHYATFYWWETREGAEADALKKFKESTPNFDSYLVSSCEVPHDFVKRALAKEKPELEVEREPSA